jgi:hypothetical protein
MVIHHPRLSEERLPRKVPAIFLGGELSGGFIGSAHDKLEYIRFAEIVY